MPRKSSWNPIAFVPTQVTLIATAVYIALFASLIYIHSTPPAAPTDPVPEKGLNLTTAWLDLEEISNGFHPYNSRRNGEVKEYLVKRIEDIVGRVSVQAGDESVVFWNGGMENVSFASNWRTIPQVCYTESENLVVYIRGEEDDAGAWWERDAYSGKGGVLLNAHYDSVSTGFGATDDGVGVVTLLQLISYFTTSGQRPKRGIVVLFNNGEEDGLYGAHAYTKHPTAKFPRTFLNLEGAGAGGRALLFRSTDAEVTRFYAQSRYPFGTSISADGFKRGFVRSGTDYSVFNEELGLRGLDVAFFEPRARYHTLQDDARDTSPDSLWHMLSAALDTTRAMTQYDGDEFSGSSSKKGGRADYGKGSGSAYFDVFGRAFAVLKLHDLFALSVSLLVAAPVLLIILEVIIAKSDKWYPFARKQYLHGSDDDEPVYLNGFRGFFRFPIAFVVATAAVAALAFLLTKINPQIVNSSEYAVWAMMLSAWFSIAWFLLTMDDRVRPTALSRMYAILWMYVISWILLVASTVLENNFQVASGYFLLIYNASVFVALLISYLELLGLPKKTRFVEHVAGVGSPVTTRPGSISSRRALDGAADERPRTSEGDDDDANERTGLLRGDDRRSQNTFTRFGRSARNQDVNSPLDEREDPFLARAYGDEQAWSGLLPQWTWILQFIVLAPINVVLIGQIALFATSALHQTSQDGSAVLPIYLIIAVLSTLLLLPLGPFLHRFTFHLPTLFFLIFIGCLVYNLLAFPFSREARMKHYFLQTIDIDTGINQVSLTGIDGFVQDIVAELPSAAGQHINCSLSLDSRRQELTSCAWSGLAPDVAPTVHSVAPYSNKTSHKYTEWVSYNITKTNTSNPSALFSFRGLSSKNCRLTFDQPATSISIANSDLHVPEDDKKPEYMKNGTSQIRLFSRDWDKTFEVEVGWADGKLKGKAGKVGCVWSDVNQPGRIPALDEVWRFEPVWSIASKADDGLVEGWRRWEI